MKKQQPILTAKNISNRFGKQELHDKISFEVYPGEIFGIVGGSGSGKTVMLKTLLGLHKPNGGEVKIKGKKIETLSPEEKAASIGVLFQQGALFSSLTVAQNIMLPLREYTDLPQRDQDHIAAMKLELAGLSADTGLKIPSQLSGGMTRRVAFARAVALDPDILFLDEPTSDLDPIIASTIDQLILRLNESLGTTFIIVTHDVNTLFTVCHRVGVLADKKLTIGTLDELLESDHPWISQFFHGPRAQGALATPQRRPYGNR